MRVSRILAIPLVLAAAGCNCDTKVQQSHGLFALSPTSLDYGVACLNETSERQLIIENKGNATLTIVSHNLTGNAFSLLEDLPTELGSSEQVAVRVGFTPTTADESTGILEITTDAETDATRRISLIGRGFDGKRQDFRVACETTPGSGNFDNENCRFLAFDDVLAGTSLDRTARLINKGCANVEVNELYFYPDPNGGGTADDVKLFSFPDGGKPFTLRGGTQVDVKLRFSAPDKAAEPSVRFKVTTTDPEKKDSSWNAGEWDLGLFANAVAPALLVDTDVLTWFDAQTGIPKERTFNVSNQGSAELKIDSIAIAANDGSTDFAIKAGDAGPFTLTPTGNTGDQKTITVVYTSSGPGSDTGTLTVTAGAEKRQIRLVAGTEPNLVVKWLDGNNNELDPPVDFGPTATGAKGVSRVVRLRNDGQAPLQVSAVDLPDSDNPAKSYKLGAFAATAIPPGGNKELTLTFDDAVTLRDDAAKLRIVSDDPLDATNGGARLVDLASQNDPNFKPVPAIDICARPNPTSACQSAAQVGLELEVDGSRTTGPEAGDTLTYQWSWGLTPPEPGAKFETPDGPKTRITSATGGKLTARGRYVVKLTVTDQFNNTNSVSQTINL